MNLLPAVLVSLGAGLASVGSAFVISSRAGAKTRVVNAPMYLVVVSTGLGVVALGLWLNLSPS